MISAQDWNWEHAQICANDPAVHGQLLPTPQMVNFIRRIQANALEHAARLSENVGDSIGQDNRQPVEELTDKESQQAEGAYMAAQRICIEAKAIEPIAAITEHLKQ